MHLQFSENSQHSYFFSQPHQPFFVLAFINAIAIMFIFMLDYKGVITMDISSANYHAYGFIYLLFTPVFFGFLLTTFPKFSSTPELKPQQYMRIFSFYYVGSALFILGSIVTPVFTGIAMLIVLTGHFLGFLILKNIYTSSTQSDKFDMFWILLSMGLGVLSHVLFMTGIFFHIGMAGFASEIGIYLYLFLLTFSVAQRMVPFFSHSLAAKNPSLLKAILILLILHIIIEGFITNGSFVIDLVIGVLIMKEIRRWQLSFPEPNPLLFILHIGLYWTAIGFILGALTNFVMLFADIHFLSLDVHVLILGFVFTMFIGFGTRVTLGHSGNNMQADKLTIALFYLTQAVVITRILSSLIAALGWNFMILIELSATLWIVLFTVWSLRYFPVLIKGKKIT